MRTSIFFIVCLLFLFSCSGGNSDSAENKNYGDSVKVSTHDYNNSLEKGKVIPKINCSKDSSVSYALYLPKNYFADKKNPIIFLFDSHGNGSLPLEKYKDLAERYGYVLAGSNNSKNGISWEQNHPQIKIFMEDVKERLHIDNRRIYTCGFSGGSRVASSVAIFDGGIACVIGMGAGFPSLSEPIRNRFDYIGFVGNEDFNMNEMVALDSSMNRTPLRHQLIIFNGKHEWAPAEIAEDAFVWLEVNAMKDGLVPKNDSLIKNFVTKTENEIINLEQKKKVYEELLLCKKMTNYLDGLADVSVACAELVSAYKKKAEELKNSDELKKIIVRKDNLAKEEVSLQGNYRSSFVLKDIAWWTNEINKLNRFSEDKNDVEKKLMNKRLISYLSLVAYMNVRSAFESRQFDLAEKFLKIYKMVDPENSEHQYLFTDLYAVRMDNSKALSSLKNAVKLGFNDIARMEADSLLSGLRNTTDYQKLLKEIKSKQ